MLRLLQDACQRYGIIWNAQNFHIDFERAMISAIEVVFPNANIHGCLFHFSQAIIRRVKALSLAEQYRTHVSVKKVVR